MNIESDNRKEAEKKKKRNPDMYREDNKKLFSFISKRKSAYTICHVVLYKLLDYVIYLYKVLSSHLQYVYIFKFIKDYFAINILKLGI